MKVIPFESREAWLAHRSADVTSTEISALFNCNPYCTSYELWHRKHDQTIVDIQPNERMAWGTRLEAAIAKGIADDNGWTVRPMKEYIRDEDARLGASFDYAIDSDACTCSHAKSTHIYEEGACRPGGVACTCAAFDGSSGGILEVKNVDSLVFKDGWAVDGDSLEAPPHIELQVQQQLLVSGRKFAWIGALVGGNRVITIKREPDPEIFAAIRNAAAEFWKSIEAGIAPKPDFEKDADFIAKLYNFAEPGKRMDATDDITNIATAYRACSEKIKALEVTKDGLKAELLTLIGDHEKVAGDGFTISAGVVGPTHVEYDRDGYRTFKVTWKKEKANG